MNIIKNKNTLKAMSRAGHIIWPVQIGSQVHSNQAYVDTVNENRNFTYKEQKYEVKYFAGAFFPFVTRNETQD